MFKKLAAVISASLGLLMLTACGSEKTLGNQDNLQAVHASGKVSVVVSFHPLMELAEAIGKDKIDVMTVVPEGTEPHDFEPKARDMVNISRAKVLIYSGLGMEPWVDKVLNNIDTKNLNVVEAAKGIDPIINANASVVEAHGQYDPHVWLGLKEAELEAKNIKDALSKADALNKEFYEKNYNEFIANADKLYNDYKQKFDNLSNKNFVTGHAAFGYLCRDFGLIQNSVEDVFAEGEPTPKKLKELVDYCKSNRINTVFVEELASPKVSETLAREVGAKTEKIFTIESKEDGKDYLQSMGENLELIYNSLKE